MTAFSCLTAACGLSNREAAEFLKVSLKSVEAWKSPDNKRNAGDGVINELKDLWKSLFNSALEAAQKIDQAEQKHIEVGLASDDYEAQQLGLPCVGAHKAMIGILIALTHADVEVVPRGSTVASAAAIEAYERGEDTL
ncbi:hypothetical protein [Acetobacter aceti]|uniref:Uncharacterized protein n=1 Tax=Acetobacter aceti TaxID=435 RepID=A0A6S6PSE4_ACEAC|nr:hypothetical protein [Acetobacter aceti]BCI68044.1 hypothetical protein AAJCM20276_26680 [Acetobacter aceti]